MSSRAWFSFFGRLRPLVKGTDPVEYRFADQPAIKDPIEALGVPHTEVDLILIDNRSVDLGYRLQNGDRARIYPFGFPLETDALRHLSPTLPEDPRFILDVHLGKLARRLRMLGFDCRYRNDYSDPQLIDLALAEKRIILTRDRGLLKHGRVKQGYLLGSTVPKQQLSEILERYRLHGRIRPFSRCTNCNGLLTSVAKDGIREQLPPKTARYYQQFFQCQSCQQLYWQGAHFPSLRNWLQELRVAP